MAQKVSGVSPVNDDPVPAGKPRSRAPRRVPIDVPDARALRPTAAPVGTYVRPAQPDQGNDMLDLAAALRGFSPTINEAFQNMEAKQKASAEAELAASTTEEMQAHVRNGTAPISSSPIARKAYAKGAAQRIALERITALDAAWNSGEFDKDNGDFDAFIAGKAKEDLANIADEDARNTYGAVLNKFSPRLRAQQTDYRVKKERDSALTMVGDTWFAAVASGISEGKTPEELQGALRGQYGKLKADLGLSPQDLDGVVLNVARRLSESPNNEKYVEHFLNDTRGGVGSIAAKQDDGVAAQVIMNKAQASTKAFQTEQLRLQNKANADRDEATVDAGIEIAAENGALAFMVPRDVRTESGGTKTVSADDQQKRGVEMIRKKAEGMVSQGNPEGGMNYRIDTLSKNGLVDPQFKSILKAGPSSATPEALAKGQVAPALKSGVNLYETLYARNPRLLAQHVGESEQFFYEAYRVARQDMGYDEAGALQTAMKFTETANPQELSQAQKQDFYKLRDAVAQLRSGGSWYNPWGDQAMTMTEDISRKIEKWGEFHIRLGKSPDDALALAKQRVLDQYTVINGNPVPTTDRTLPGNLSDLADFRIKQWVKANGEKYGIDASDLTVEPASDGQQGVWTIVRKDGNGPVMATDPAERASLTFSLRGAKEEMDMAERERVVREQNNPRSLRQKFKDDQKEKGIKWIRKGKPIE